MSESGKNTLKAIAVVVVLGAIYAAYRLGQEQVEPPTGLDSMVQRIRGFGFSPLPAPQRDLAPGSAYRYRESKLVPFGSPGQVFEATPWLPETPASWNQMLASGRFVDRVSTSARGKFGVENFLGIAGIQASFEHDGVVRIETSVDRLEKWEVTELSLRQAKIRKETLASLQGGGIMVIQGVLRAKGLEVSFRTKDRMLDKGAVESMFGKVGGSQEGVIQSDGKVRYENLVLGYYDNPWFITPLPTNPQERRVAAEVVARLDAVEEVEAQTVGDALFVRAPTNRIPLVAEIARTGADLARESGRALEFEARADRAVAEADDAERRRKVAEESADQFRGEAASARQEANRYRLATERSEARLARAVQQLDASRQQVEAMQSNVRQLEEELRGARGGEPRIPPEIVEAREKLADPRIRVFLRRRTEPLRRQLQADLDKINERLRRSFTIESWRRNPEALEQLVQRSNDRDLRAEYQRASQRIAELEMIDAVRKLMP